MFKNTLIAALALLGATSAAAYPQAENVRLVIIWGDEFASGGQIDAATPATGPSLTDAGYFFGASGEATDTRAATWTPVSYNDGYSGESRPDSLTPASGGTDFSASIAWMGKRRTGDKVCVLNLASPGTDVDVPGFFEGGRWPMMGYEATTGVAKAFTANSTVRADIFSAVAALATTLPAGSNIDMDGIVFSCWNNGTAEVFADDDNFLEFAVPYVHRSDYQNRANMNAQNVCGSVASTFREEFEAAYGGTGYFTLSSVKPALIGLQRPKAGRSYMQSLLRQEIFARHIYASSAVLQMDPAFWDPANGPFPGTSVLSPCNPAGVVYIGDSDSLQLLGAGLHQSDLFHLSSVANRNIGWQMGSVIFP